MTYRLSFFAVLCILLVAGCARPLALTVDSIGAAHQGERYVILPGMDSVRADDLFFMEHKRRLAELLASMRYQVTENEAEATAAVLLSWRTTEEAAARHDDGPRMGIGMGSGSGGHYRGGSFFGLGVGFPVSGSSTPSPAYRHHITLDAISFAPGAQDPATGKSLWKVNLTATDDENNPRAAFPIMLEAARPYIGADSQGAKTVSVPR